MPVIPFSLQCTIPENRLIPLKDSENKGLKTVYVSNIPGFKYRLSVCPNGRKDTNRKEVWVYLYLKLGNVKKVEGDISIVIESADFSVEDHITSEKSVRWGDFVCKTEDFFKPKKKFIVDGKFTIKVCGTFEYENGDAPTSERQKWDGGELGNDFWDDNGSKDFTIVVDGKELKAQKLFLRTRSDVFKAMFNPNTKESIENKTKISGFTFDVVETAVKMIYNCNFTSLLSLDEMMSLLCFFDEYNIPSLKEKVKPFLINQISAATVCRLTNASIFTNSLQLKNKCLKFLEKSFASKTPLSDIQILDKDIIVEVVQNMVCHTVEIQ